MRRLRTVGTRARPLRLQIVPVVCLFAGLGGATLLKYGGHDPSSSSGL